jgi:hypothetical protein
MASLARLCSSWLFVWVLLVSVLGLVAAVEAVRAVATFAPGTAVEELPIADGRGGEGDAEALVLDAHRRGRIWATIIRPPVMYGRRDRQFARASVRCSTRSPC